MRERRERAAAPMERAASRDVQEAKKMLLAMKQAKKDMDRDWKTFRQIIASIAEAALIESGRLQPDADAEARFLRDALKKIAEVAAP